MSKIKDEDRKLLIRRVLKQLPDRDVRQFFIHENSPYFRKLEERAEMLRKEKSAEPDLEGTGRIYFP